MEPIALRLDDVGACSKRYEVYADHQWGVISANWLFLKYLPAFRRWGPYRELTATEWRLIFQLLERHRAKLTVAVTAAWPVNERRLIPFPLRFPEEASVLKVGVKEELIEIANHGLTHCVVRNNAFKPRWFDGNRTYHREFWNWVPAHEQEDHLRQSQEILEEYFEVPVVTFVPPGNVFAEETLEMAARHGLRYVSCRATPRFEGVPAVIGNEGVEPFHDRDLVLHGLSWLARQLETHQGRRFCFVKELGAERVLAFAVAPKEEPVAAALEPV